MGNNPNPERPSSAELSRRVQEIMTRAGAKGIRVDLPKWEQTKESLREQIAGAQSQLNELVGHPVRTSSRKEVAALLFDELGLPETPKRSIAKEALAHHQHPAIELIQTINSLGRVLSLMVNSEQYIRRGRLESLWKATNDTSGRIYCSEANIQQISIPARKALVPYEGKIFIFWDYKQFELRVLAALSGCQALVEVLNTEDPHRSVVSRMRGIPVNDVNEEDRNQGKVLNFGIIYGMGEESLASKLGTTPERAKQLITEYFEALPGLRDYLDRVIRQARKNGYIQTALGHRRPLTEWETDPAHTGRQAVNTLVQGSAADFLKLAIVVADQEPELEVVATVHDSVLVQVDREKVTPEYLEKIRAKFEFSIKGVEFPIDLGTGESWGEAQESLKGEPQEDEVR